MSTSILKPRQALNKAYLKVRPIRSDMDRFKTNLYTYWTISTRQNRKNTTKTWSLNSLRKHGTILATLSIRKAETTRSSTMGIKIQL